MTVSLPLHDANADTVGAATSLVDQLALADGTFEHLTFMLSGEKQGDPTAIYTWVNDYLFSCNAGVATLRASGASPFVLNPGARAFVVTVDANAANARISVTGIVGENWTWVAKITGLQRTRLPTGTLAAWDPAVAGTLTPYQDFAYTGANLIVDGDMEAVGTAAWTAYNVAALTKELGTPYSGLRCLRAQCPGGVSLGGAEQSPLPVGIRAYHTVWLRTTSVAGAMNLYANGVNLVTATFNPAWTQLKAAPVITTLAHIVYYQSGTNGAYIEIDDAVSTRLSIVTQQDSIVSGGAALTTGVLATRPTYLNTAAALAQSITGACDQYDGAAGGQYWNTGIIPPPELTFGGWFYIDSIAAGTPFLWGSGDVGAATWCIIYRSTALFVVEIGTGAAFVHGTALTVGWHCLMAGGAGTVQKSWLDGVPATGLATTAARPQFPMAIMARNYNGSIGGNASGYTGLLLVTNNLLTDADALDFYRSTYRT